jgi:hypothetical protein
MIAAMAACNGGGAKPLPTDSMASLNGSWELQSIDCGAEPSVLWKEMMAAHPLSARKYVNNGQTIDYVVDSDNCLQTTTGAIDPQGSFLFNKFGYQKYCNSSCNQAKMKCGPISTSNLARIQVVGKEMTISENDDGTCRQRGQVGPVTARYLRLFRHPKK